MEKNKNCKISRIEKNNSKKNKNCKISRNEKTIQKKIF